MTKHSAILDSMRIKKFRSINIATIDLKEETALVGQNSSGKSAILRALNCVFNYEQEKHELESGTHKYRAGTQSIIEVTITGLKPTRGIPDKYIIDGAHTVRMKHQKKTIWEVKSIDGWTGLGGSLPAYKTALKQQIDFYLVPVRRDHTVANDPSVKLMEEVIESWLDKNRKRDRISPQLSKIGTNFRRSLDTLETQLRSYSPETWPFDIRFAFSTEPNFRLFLPGLGLEVNEGDHVVSIQDSGSGTQSLAIFSLYASLANLNEAQVVLGFEEPELNLHPQAQRQLIDHLRTYNLQLIFTTHSHTIIDSVSHDSIVLCQKSFNAAGRLETTVSQLPRNFYKKYDLEEKNYNKFHRRNSSQFIFADAVVVVESPIDAEVITAVMAENNVDLHRIGVAVIPLGGVRSLSYMYFLLKELNIPSRFIVDKDFFVCYERGERSKSLDSNGFPRYAKNLNSNNVIEHLFRGIDDHGRQQFAKDCSANHTAVLDFLQNHDFICFNYDLDTDLLCAERSRRRIVEFIGGDANWDKDSQLAFLQRNSKLRKKTDALLYAVDGAAPRQLPNSYKRFLKNLKVL